MTPIQYLRILWVRKWIFLGLFLLVSAAGIAYTLSLPKRYVAEVSMLLEVRPDPILGAVAPGLTAPVFLATQVEMIKSHRVASHVVKLLGIDKNGNAQRAWMEATQGKMPIDAYYGEQLLGGLSVEVERGTSFITLSYSAPDPKFAAAAVNAFSQAYLDVAVDMRVEPARQYAAWFDVQSKGLRTDLEQAQARLSRYQQEKGITDDRLEDETARLNVLIGQLATAQAERADANSRQGVSGGEASPDVLQSSTVQALRAQLGTVQARLTEISAIVGTSHPQRLALEAQAAQLQQQIAAEMRRVSSSTSAVSRASSRKLAELQGLVDAQKARVLAMKSSRDEMQVLVKDVENAQRAYENARSKLSQLSLESQTNQHNVRIMSPAIEPLRPSSKETLKRMIMFVGAGLVVGLAAAFGLELLDRRVRSPEDLLVADGVPVLGVLSGPNSKVPALRQLSYGGPPHMGRPALPAAGAR